MSDVVVVQTTAAGAGASIAVEVVGSNAYQFLKLVDGSVSATTPIVATTGVPAAGTAGLVVAVKPGVSVSMPAVSGVVATSVPTPSNAFGMPVWIVGGQTA